MALLAPLPPTICTRVQATRAGIPVHFLTAAHAQCLEQCLVQSWRIFVKQMMFL